MFLSVIRLRSDWRQYMSTYHMHCRICMAFPTHERARRDPDFIESFLPDDFVPGKIHVPRDQENNYLFRVDSNTLIVQSGLRPNWDYCFLNAKFLVEGITKVGEITHQAEKGKTYRFTLRANPSKQSVLAVAGGPEKNRRFPLIKEEEQIEWMARKSKEHGFTITPNTLEVQQEGTMTQQKSSTSPTQYRHISVNYTGIMKVADADKVCSALVTGIGPGKAFGFGLLLTRPVG